MGMPNVLGQTGPIQRNGSIESVKGQPRGGAAMVVVKRQQGNW